jgi:NAD-dependent SIR2 family protein deacetylase
VGLPRPHRRGGRGRGARFPYRAITPGKLSAGHLAQRDDCFSGHTLLDGALDAKCAACHRPGDLGVRTTKEQLVARRSARTRRIHEVIRAGCDRCHSGHGPRAGSRRFAHFPLPTAVAAGCAACHADERPKDAFHAAGSAGAAECTPCHGTSAWKPATFEHEKAFRFDRHHPPRCTDCHPPGRSLKEYTCTECHEHALDRLERKHREEGITDFDRCRRCHPSGDEDDTIRRKGGRGGRAHEDEKD